MLCYGINQVVTGSPGQAAVKPGEDNSMKHLIIDA
jgi:hypothetical protein